MKRYKRIVVLLAVLLAACIATFAVSRYEEYREEIQNSDAVILEIDPDTVTALSWSYDETSLSFHKDETWQYDGDAAFPVDADKIADLLDQFSQFGVSFIIENVEDYAQYGLDEPTCTIDLTAGDTGYTISWAISARWTRNAMWISATATSTWCRTIPWTSLRWSSAT